MAVEALMFSGHGSRASCSIFFCQVYVADIYPLFFSQSIKGKNHGSYRCCFFSTVAAALAIGFGCNRPWYWSRYMLLVPLLKVLLVSLKQKAKFARLFF